ncbi:DUF317 domain-containing protein [Streptomycetaceae bacterium NBC_01309]
MRDGIPAVSVPARFAGGVDPDPALEVIRAAGWTQVTDPAGNIHARHPDGRVYAGWLPEFAGDRTWQLRYTDTANAPADWTADLSDDTPTAAVAAYLAALTGEHDTAHDPFTPATGPGGPACPDTATAAALLTAARWDIDRHGNDLVEARHGDGDLLAAHGDLPPAWWTLHGHPAPRPLLLGGGWAVLCTVGPGGPEVWRAVFGGMPPMTAVAAFLAAATDPATVPADELNVHVRARYA